MPVFPIKEPLKADGLFSIGSDDQRHLLKVLRKKPGDYFEVILPDGRKATAKLTVHRGHVMGFLESFQSESGPDLLPLWLGVALVRWQRMDWLVEKATELGVSRLSPLLFSRSRYQRNYEFSSNKYNRLKKIVNETLKQCERRKGPQIDPPEAYSQWLKKTDSEVGQKILLSERASSPPLKDEISQDGRSLLLMVGPEGGLESEEIELIEAHGFKSVSLGPKILRTETAGIYGACVLDFLLCSQRK